MKTLQTYKSFNNDKSIEELQYNLLKDVTGLENLKFELKFYKTLLGKPIYKPHTLNLYERLTQFKKEVNTINKNTTSILIELNSHAHQLSNKIECDEIACDNFFIKTHDNIELKVFNLKTKVFNFKFRLFQFLENVINN
jgi:hypothetical protein